MNYKSIQNKLARRNIKVSQTDMKDKFPDLEAVTEDQIIDFYSQAQSTLVPSTNQIMTVANSMDIALSVNDALTIGANFSEYSSNSYDGLDLVESAIKNYIQRESEVLEARVAGMTSRLSQEVDQSISKANDQLATGLQTINNKIRVAKETTKSNFRNVAEYFNGL